MLKVGDLAKIMTPFSLWGVRWESGTPCIVVYKLKSAEPEKIWRVMIPDGSFTLFDEHEILRIT